MATKRVKITKEGQEAEVMPQTVKAWERNGWTVADDGSSTELASQPEPPAPAPSGEAQ